ncbi:carboxymuconolactone decarboxylase family protein [Nonomuraea sp. SYSU D8015]|uniref:carboxymuconolactone decarboxylase family protein n=1 Tax=Nonomuraea sp. SYSU D8015 TaxID=2593644 RepID=UPI0016608C30|nr:carboxymuconolactone decarboxylase family protein [Nonomuraea sp. SYSU D8015]
MVDLPSSPLAEVDAEFETMALETGGFTFGLRHTTTREKLLQVAAHDICLANVGLAFKMHVMAAHQHGASYADLLALIRFVAPYSGYPAAASALSALKQYAGELGLEVAADTDPGRGVPAGQEAVWPVADSWMADFLASRLGRAWSEERLSRRERAFVALAALVTLQALGPSFRRHVELALQVAGPDEVRDAVRFTAEMGVTKAVAALEELDEVLAGRA